jgi:outer membrane lipoprotein SlyB
MSVKHYGAALAAALLTGCANMSTDPGTGSTRNTLISVSYGTVENVQQVQMKAKYAEGSLIGGALGLLAASHYSAGSQALGALAGAGLGALVSKETAGTANQYTIRLVNGNTVSVVTDQKEIHAGDCVSVEQGEQTNIRRVSSALCNTPPSHPAYSEMHASVLQISADCAAAKQQLLRATTEQETDIAYKKMQALCD